MEPVKHRKKENPNSHSLVQVPKTNRFKQRAIKSALVFTAALVTSPFALGQENKKPDLSKLNKSGIERTASDIKSPLKGDKLALLLAPKGGAGPSAREISGGDVVTIPGRDWRNMVDPDSGLALGAIAGKLPKITVSELEQLAAKTNAFKRQYNPTDKSVLGEDGYFSAAEVKVPRPDTDLNGGRISLVAGSASLGSFVNTEDGKVITTNCAWISFLDENGARKDMQISLVPVLQLYEMITGQKAKVVKIVADPGKDENGPYIGFFFCPDESLNSNFRANLPSLYALYQNGEVYCNGTSYSNPHVFMAVE